MNIFTKVITHHAQCVVPSIQIQKGIFYKGYSLHNTNCRTSIMITDIILSTIQKDSP